MEKTSPAPGSGWSLGLMSAIALFGVSSAFMVLHQPAPDATPSPPVAAAEQPLPEPPTLPPEPLERAPELVAPAQPAPTPVATAPSKASKAVPAEKVSTKQVSPTKPAAPVKREKSRAATSRLVEEALPKLPRKPTSDEPATESQSAVEGKVRILDQAPAPQPAAPAPAAPTSLPSTPAPAAPVATPPAASEAAPAAQTTRAVIAEPLVKAPFKPKVVMANAQRVWVKLDEQQTLIFDKGHKVPHFGVYQGFDGKTAQFDSGSVPLSATE